MKRSFLLFTAALAASAISLADNASRCGISDLDILKSEQKIAVNFNFDPAAFKMKSGKKIMLTPAVVAGKDTVRLDPIAVAGKNAWYYAERNKNVNDAPVYRAGKRGIVKYSRTIPYETWMESSTVEILCDTLNVCNCEPPYSGVVPVAELDYRPRKFNPVFNYAAPRDSAEKRFNLSGRADVRFIVNRTEIDWKYADNVAQLDSIIYSVNAVRDDSDASVDRITLTGYASPEGPYRNNVRLAKGRTEAVKEYVRKHSSFPAKVYHTDYVAEDWAGLAAWIKESNLPRKEEMLDFINNPAVAVETKNDEFRRKFPENYQFLLQNVYPSLRHTDYRITYTVRKYLNVDEIREVMKRNPRNLSLNELFLLANSLKQGSAEYDEVFDLAVKLFPDNEVANLNAANSAMNRGDFRSAERYLERAGNDAEATYARGVLKAMQGEYDEALPLLRKAAGEGISAASESIEEIERLRNFSGNVKLL